MDDMSIWFWVATAEAAVALVLSLVALRRAPLATGDWHHWCLSQSDGRSRVYRDGEIYERDVTLSFWHRENTDERI